VKLPFGELLSEGELPEVAHDRGVSPGTNNTISAKAEARKLIHFCQLRLKRNNTQVPKPRNCWGKERRKGAESGSEWTHKGERGKLPRVFHLLAQHKLPQVRHDSSVGPKV